MALFQEMEGWAIILWFITTSWLRVCVIMGNLQLQEKSFMIKGLCQEELIDEACELLEKMDGNGGSPNDRTYNKVIQVTATWWNIKGNETSPNNGWQGCFQQVQPMHPCWLNWYLQIQGIKQCKNYFNNLYEDFYFFYILGAWPRSGFGKEDSIAMQITKREAECNMVLNLNFETSWYK